MQTKGQRRENRTTDGRVDSRVLIHPILLFFRKVAYRVACARLIAIGLVFFNPSLPLCLHGLMISSVHPVPVTAFEISYWSNVKFVPLRVFLEVISQRQLIP